MVFRRVPLAIALGVLPTLCTATPGEAGSKPKSRTVFHDDAQVLLEAPEKNTSAYVKAWLDRETEFVPFTTFVFLAATPDVCTYQTNAGEVYGARFGEEFQGGWAPGIRGLKAEGTDALELVTEHMKAKGLEVLAAVRMSDTHHKSLDPGNPFCPQFAIDHPEYVIKQPDGRTNETALDYSHPEVRAHRLAIMQEIVEEYEVDGLELNFIRWAKHFPRDKGRQNAPVLTEYLGEIRRTMDRAAKKRGVKRLTLGVVVPESVEACWLAGVDVKTWARSGWVDYIVLSTWNNTDPQLPVGEFTRFTKPAGVQTLVAMGNMIGSVYAGPPKVRGRGIAMSAKHADNYQGMLLTEPEARGAAANYYGWGADGISFWNVGIHFGDQKTAAPEQRERIRKWTHAVVDPQRACSGPRKYHYLPMGKGMGGRKPPVRNYPWADEGKSPLGHTNSPVLRFGPEEVGKRLAFPFRMADGRDGGKLEGRLRFWVYHMTEADELTVDINGRPVPPSKIRRIPAGEYRAGLPGVRFEIALADCPPFRGENELGLTLQTEQKRNEVPYMEELIVLVEEAEKPAGRTSGVSQKVRSSSPPPREKPLKIYVAVDSEGPTGVAEYWARSLPPKSPAVRRYRELLTEDVNAAVEGCFAGGATQVFVKDDGFRDENILPELLDKRARLLAGGGPLLDGLDESFDGVMLIGFHAMEGAEDGVLAHTWSSARRRRYWINGRESGELAVYAIVAGHDHQVPVLLVTGCTGLCREAHELLGDNVVTVAVKKLREDKMVELFPPERTRPLITAGAKKAIRRIGQCQPYNVKFPLRIRLQLKNKSVTDGYIQWRLKNQPGWPGKRVDEDTIEATLRTTRFIVL